MNSYNVKCLRVACLLTVAAAFSSCGKEDASGGGGAVINESAQTITLAVANTGDNFLATRAATARPLYSSEASQNIEKVKVVIYKLSDAGDQLPEGVSSDDDLANNMSKFTLYGKKTIVAQKVFSPWMNNGVSNAYNNATYGNGRQASWTLSAADQITEEGVYMAYAVGYNDGEYDALKSGSTFGTLSKSTEGNEVTFEFPLSVKQNEKGSNVAPKVYEVFAGSAPFVVTKKQIKESNEYSYQFNVSLTLHRQVAGTIGYFTNIPVYGNADHAKEIGYKLRLVASHRSDNAVFAAFNSEYTGVPGDATKNVKYVVNGWDNSNKTQAADTTFYGSSTNDAYKVYEIKLSDWFKGTTGSTVGMDTNNDGMLNGEDTNWKNAIDSENNTPGVRKGTVLGSSFLFPFAMASEKPTFQLQMLSEKGVIIRYWNIRLQASSSTDSQIEQYASIVSSTGTANNNSTQENSVNYSILRNHLYNIGTRNNGDGGGNTQPDGGDNDKAQPLNNETLILRVNDNWEMIHEMEID